MSIIVLDTNIFISALLSPSGVCRQILRMCLHGQLSPLIGEALYHEYEDVLGREELFVNCPISSEVRNELFDAYLNTCQWTKIYYKWRPNLRDEADNHLIELAIAGQAETIITRNIRDLSRGELHFDQLRICQPEAFLKE